MSLLVLKAGLQDTVQDLGRQGYAHLGIHASGAADPVALRIANILAGNKPCTAALEMHFPAPQLRFEQPACFVLAGANFDAQLDGQKIPAGTRVLAAAGSSLVFRRQLRGMRVYLSVHGGFEIKPWLESFSTSLIAGAGGWQGRALQAGDRLVFQKDLEIPVFRSKILSWRANVTDLYPANALFRILPGPEYTLLNPHSRNQLETTGWRLNRQSNRMACMLDGPPLALQKSFELVSSAVLPGTMQLLPNGNVLILMADCQTTGGYPRIAQIIGADLPGLAQWTPMDVFRLQAISLETAIDAGKVQRQILRKMELGVQYK